MEDFVKFETAKKLKEKGFDCKYPLAMYDEGGLFYPLFTSCDEDENSNCIFGKRLYYDYEDFLDNKSAIIAPTISQVLKWLRDKKAIHIDIAIWEGGWYCDVWVYGFYEEEKEYLTLIRHQSNDYESYEDAALAGIEYVLDNLI